MFGLLADSLAMFGLLADSFSFVYGGKDKDKSPRLTQNTRLLQISLVSNSFQVIHTLNINHQTQSYGQMARAFDSSEDVSKSSEKSHGTTTNSKTVSFYLMLPYL